MGPSRPPPPTQEGPICPPPPQGVVPPSLGGLGLLPGPLLKGRPGGRPGQPAVGPSHRGSHIQTPTSPWPMSPPRPLLMSPPSPAHVSTYLPFPLPSLPSLLLLPSPSLPLPALPPHYTSLEMEKNVKKTFF